MPASTRQMNRRMHRSESFKRADSARARTVPIRVLARSRAVRRLARPLHRAAQDRRRHHPHRPGVQPPRRHRPGPVHARPEAPGGARARPRANCRRSTWCCSRTPTWTTSTSRSLRRLENRGTTVVTAARTADLLRARRYAAVRELAWGERAQRRAARRPRLPGEPLGRAHAQRHVPRLQRLHHRSRPLPHPLRRRHRHDHRFPRLEDLAPLRPRHHAGGRLQSLDPLPLHARAGLADGAATPAPNSSCRSITRPSRSAASLTSNRSSASTSRPAITPTASPSTASARNSSTIRPRVAPPADLSLFFSASFSAFSASPR